jgi:hypothetical protein
LTSFGIVRNVSEYNLKAVDNLLPRPTGIFLDGAYQTLLQTNQLCSNLEQKNIVSIDKQSFTNLHSLIQHTSLTFPDS